MSLIIKGVSILFSFFHHFMENLEAWHDKWHLYRHLATWHLPLGQVCPPDMQVANNVAKCFFWFNVVLIKVDTFTIFDTMESMKGHKNTEEKTDKVQHHTFSYWFCLALGGTSLNHRPRVR